MLLGVAFHTKIVLNLKHRVAKNNRCANVSVEPIFMQFFNDCTRVHSAYLVHIFGKEEMFVLISVAGVVLSRISLSCSQHIYHAGKEAKKNIYIYNNLVETYILPSVSLINGNHVP